MHSLRQADALSLSLVAEMAGIVVGHVAASPVQISDGALHWYGLRPISVQPGFQCKSRYPPRKSSPLTGGWVIKVWAISQYYIF